MVKIDNSDVSSLAQIAASIRNQYSRKVADDKWQDSPFKWIRLLPPAQKGKIGVQLITSWCAVKGLNIRRAKNSQADKVIEDRNVEFKFSLLWDNGIYKFQQIRDQDYVYLICLGISPFDAHCWVIPKQLALQQATPQHGGRIGRDTLWFSINPLHPPEWVSKYGGTLHSAYNIFASWRSNSTSKRTLE